MKVRPACCYRLQSLRFLRRGLDQRAMIPIRPQSDLKRVGEV